MNPEKIANDLARKNGGKLLRFRETPTQIIVLLTDGRKFYHEKGAPIPQDEPAPKLARKNAKEE